MTRFHLVVANYRRATSFTEKFASLRGFDPDIDKVVFFDCSPEAEWEMEYKNVQTLAAYGLQEDKNLIFFRRRTWNVCHGAHLDYFSLLLNQELEIPSYTLFMQDHYLDLARFVKEDTIPSSKQLCLTTIESLFKQDPEVGCCYLTRNGIRVSVTSSAIHPKVYGDHQELLTDTVERHLFIDGLNCAVRPELYLPWMAKNPRRLTQGDGSYPAAFVWEIRLGWILYEQGIRWHDLANSVTFRSISELRELEKCMNQSLSKRWYDHRLWAVMYGRDMGWYWPIPWKDALALVLNKFLATIRSTTPRAYLQRIQFRVSEENVDLTCGGGEKS